MINRKKLFLVLLLYFPSLYIEFRINRVIFRKQPINVNLQATQQFKVFEAFWHIFLSVDEFTFNSTIVVLSIEEKIYITL